MCKLSYHIHVDTEKLYVLTGQLTNGQYYLAYGQEKKNIQAKKGRVLRPNAGLVYVA